MKKSVVIAGFIFILLQACHKQEITMVSVMTTTEVTDITPSTAKSGGSISTGAWLSAFGLCCSTKSNPTVNDIVEIDSTKKTAQFAMTIKGLQGNTKYYLRAFAIKSDGIVYGNEFSFTTQPPTAPVMLTSEATNITSGTIVSGGKLMDTGGADVTDIGICWSTSPSPDLTKDKLSTPVDTNNFISLIPGLNPETTYYLRTYATNKEGTGFGNEITFKTTTAQSTVIDIDGNVYSSVQIGNQIWLQQNLKTTRYSNGDPIGTTTSDWSVLEKETTPRYQWAYNGDERNVPMYGRLYTWYVVSDPRNICPTGWHASTHDEWMTLFGYLASTIDSYGSFGGGLAKSISDKNGWNSSDDPYSPGSGQASNNSSGFSGLPGGAGNGNNFEFLGSGAYWWSSTDISDNMAWDGCYIWHGYGSAFYGSRIKYDGLSVRCLKNN